jgi:ATP-dependent protease ClpP protease subunit
MKRFYNFSVVNEDVTLRLDGNIVDAEDVWIYEWLGLECTTPNAFRDELAKYKGKNITLWIDSYGGSVFAATGIYNALMEHKSTGSKITAIVDGKAMSAATIPFMAGDERLISPGGMFMMHNPLSDPGMSYASDLRKAADVLDEVKECILNAYELATGKSRDEISKLMESETYMSAKTAVDSGFATGIKFAQGKDSNESPESIMNFMFNRMDIQNAASDSAKQFFELIKNTPEGATQEKPVADNKPKEGGTDMEIKNVEDLRQAYPELVNQVEKDAAKKAEAAERTRIQNIEKIANIVEPDLLEKAKFETPMDEKELAFQNAVQQAKLGDEYLNKAKKDAQNSGGKDVGGAPTGGNDDEQLKQENQVNALVNAVERIRGGK